MSYIGNAPTVGQWRKLTDISPSFDGVTTSFITSVPPGTSAYYVTAGSANQLIISLGGVIQQPDVDYSVSTNNITFTTAPAAGLDFFGILAGDALNTAAPSDGTITSAKLAGNLTVDLAAGSAANPSLTFDANTGLYSTAEDEVAISTGGTERIRIGTAGQIGLGGANYGTNGQVLTSAGSGAVPTWTTPSTTTDIISEGNTSAEVIDTGSDGRFVVTTEGSERARIDSSGRLLVGTSTSEGNMAVAPQVQLEGTTVDGSTSAIKCNGGTTAGNGARLYLNRSRGTSLTSRTVVASGDTLGGIYFGGADGANIQPAALIEGYVDGTPGAGDMPGRLVFSTTADGASSPTERMRIGSDGLITISGPGIKFPATQVASADANTLDDYEEGTWTPTVEGSSTAGTVTYSTRTGTYVKIGKVVFIYVALTWTGGTGTGNLKVTGLPFNPTDFSAVSFALVDNLAATANYVPLMAQIHTNGGIFPLQALVGGNTPGNANVPYDAAATMFFSGHYPA